MKPNLSFERDMTLAFESRFVSCNDAIGGEILQVNFDTISSIAAEEERETPYVLITRPHPIQ
jgi:hypothetical protein